MTLRLGLRSVIPALAVTLSSVASGATIDYIQVDGFEAGPDCSVALTCPAPLAGKACIAGQLASAAVGTPLRAFFNPFSTCAEGASGGACDLRLAAYDAVQFASNPGAAAPLVSGENLVDGCGRFRIGNVTPPASGIVAIVSDDVDPGSDLHAPTAALGPLAANAQAEGFEVVATRRDTVALWTQSAGGPFGASTFADVGVALLQFRVGGTPRQGVAVVVDGNPASTKDYYFSDAAPDRLHVDAQVASTGADGAALLANGGSAFYSGTGAEPMGCAWPGRFAFTTPGVVVFLPFDC